MDISDSLTRVSRLILKDRVSHLKVYVHAPSATVTHDYLVTIECFRGDQKLRASGLAFRRYEAFVKALVELGEVILCRDFGLVDRSGVAGGLLRSQAMDRAKAELVERDAFLFHYQNEIPFLNSQEIEVFSPLYTQKEKLFVYSMMAAISAYHCVLVTDPHCSTGKSACLLLGLGAHRSRGVAISKALGEYACMRLDHQLRPGWCEKIAVHPQLARCLPDRHHGASRDPRNRERFQNLCRINLERSSQNRDLQQAHEWKIQALRSPLRYFKYFRVTHSDLKPLQFGQPELNPKLNKDEIENPLYHPLW